MNKSVQVYIVYWYKIMYHSSTTGVITGLFIGQKHPLDMFTVCRNVAGWT